MEADLAGILPGTREREVLEAMVAEGGELTIEY
jgi:hypothetical protein